ncbi:MAG: PilN domain-containing protein [Acidobacteriota bacterium]
MSRALNLARRPFVNARPVRRVAILLWVLGAGLLVGNAYLFQGYRQSSAGKQAELALVRDRIASEERKIASVDGDLERSRVPQLMQQVQFLNLRIAERTFDWGRLFDRLAEALPWDVRILNLSPVSVVPDETAARRQGGLVTLVPRDRFQLRISGTAQSDEALLKFVDALFKHASFEGPNLHREDRKDGVSFDLSVTYLPGAEAAPGDAPAKASTNATGREAP